MTDPSAASCGRPPELRTCKRNSARDSATETVRIRKVRLAICALILLLIQVCVAYRFSYGVLRVDLLYALAGFLTLEAAPAGALWSVLAIGVLRDLGSSARIGASALPMVVATASLLPVKDRVNREIVSLEIALLFVYALFGGILEAVGVALASGALWSVLLGYAVGQALLTAALAPALFFVFEWAGLVDKKGALLA